MGKDYIYIFKGDDTNWNNEKFLEVILDSEIDLSEMTAKFILGSYSKTFPLTTPKFNIDLLHAITGSFAYGPIDGIIQIIDSENRIKTVTNTIPFFVTNNVIDVQDAQFECNVSPNSPIQIVVKIGGGSGKTEWGFITGRISDQEDLQEALAAKVSKSGDTMTGPLSFGDFSISTDDGLAKIEGTQYGLRVDTTTGLGAALLTANGLGDVLTSLNVQSTYSATGMDPVNGTAVNSALLGINALIPSQATDQNQLADKNFVNSSIATNTANFIGTFNSLAELEAYSGTVTNNDYAFVVGVDSDGNTVYKRYKYTTATEPAEWEFEYTLNNSSFTAAQWAAINSGITDTAVTQIGTNATNIGTLTTDKQPKTLATPITVEGTPQTTVEGALGAINTLAGKGVQNTATGTGSLSILGNSSSYSYSVNIGNTSNARGIGAVAMGNQANARENGAVAIGTQSISDTYSVSVGGYSQATGAYSVAIGGYTNKATQNSAIAIGSGAQATAQQAIQIGYGTNSTAKTMQVFSHQLLDANGKIPNARLPYATSSAVGGVRISIDANNVVTIYTGD